MLNTNRMQKIKVLLVSAFIVLFALVGCATTPAPSTHILAGDLVSSGYTIADTLLSQSKIGMDRNSNILVASFVNINNLTESSTFGRMIAEHVSSRIAQRGYKVVDMRLRNKSVFMEEGKGEFLLSRDFKEVVKNHNATAVVVGTYGESLNGIYVSARMVIPSDNSIISSCDYGLKMGRAGDVLLRNK